MQAKSPVKTMTRVEAQPPGRNFSSSISPFRLFLHHVGNSRQAASSMPQGAVPPAWWLATLAAERKLAALTFSPDLVCISAGSIYEPR